MPADEKFIHIYDSLFRITKVTSISQWIWTRSMKVLTLVVLYTNYQQSTLNEGIVFAWLSILYFLMARGADQPSVHRSYYEANEVQDVHRTSKTLSPCLLKSVSGDRQDELFAYVYLGIHLK